MSGYRLLWMQVMFDLPVVDLKERRAAVLFRNKLLDLGFNMAQFSIYLRHIKDKEQANTYYNKIATYVPDRGSVHILVFTDKQYENIKTFEGRVVKKMLSPKQLLLF